VELLHATCVITHKWAGPCSVQLLSPLGSGWLIRYNPRFVWFGGFGFSHSFWMLSLHNFSWAH